MLTELTAGAGFKLDATCSPSPHTGNGLKASKDKPPCIKWRIAGCVHSRIVVHPFLSGLKEGFVGPYLPCEDNLLAFFGRNGLTEIGVLAVRDEILPAFDDFKAAIFLEESRPVLSPSAIGVDLTFRHGDHETANIHALSLLKSQGARFDRISKLAQIWLAPTAAELSQ
ncbi:hypothetical protein FHW92_001919 [Novosphingobium sp. SG707]|nr:hypothetical protein [Novosphingobium sp. SG707]